MEIPTVPGRPFVGNMGDIDQKDLPGSLYRLGKIYGPCFRVSIGGFSVVCVGSQELLNEVADEKRFDKVQNVLSRHLRNGIEDGLLTAYPQEENWWTAHRILAPKFSPVSLSKMFPELHDIAGQLVTKWARYPGKAIDPTDDFTRLTLDSIALCAMGTRFNSFYTEDIHPFAKSMSYFLTESMARSVRPQFVSDYIYRASSRQYHESIETMKSIAQKCIDDRRTNPTDKNDLLNAMLFGKDPQTGKGLSDDSIVHNAITFLIAGHETTANMLSFLFVELLRNPDAMRKAREEVDRIVGKGPVHYEHIGKLPYVSACLRESLRLWSPIQFFVRGPTQQEGYPLSIGRDQFEVQKGDVFLALLRNAHRDPAVYGDDAEAFRPERMLDKEFQKLPAHSWQPFGSGKRACIGRSFAWAEAHIIIAMLLQNFTFRAEDPSYQMQLKTTLTVKPENFRMYATLRKDVDPLSLEKRIWGAEQPTKAGQQENRKIEATATNKALKPLNILFGSNTGTCEALAQNLAGAAASRGHKSAVKSMDDGIEDLSMEDPVVVITASFEGEPPDNARHFVDWLENHKEPVKAKFAVYGCGNREWANTFQRIPKLCDKLLTERGGQRITDVGCSDVADGTFFDDFDQWCEEQLWPTIGGEESAAAGFGLDIEMLSGSRASDLRQDVGEGQVLSNTLLTAPDEPTKKHIEIQLPSGMEYSAGDYLAVLPINPTSTVKRVMAHFQIPWDGRMRIKEGQHTSLPKREVTIFGLLSVHVELNQPCTKKHLATLVKCTKDEKERQQLESLSNMPSVFELLERFPSCILPFGDFLAMLNTLRVRQYSISSSALVSAEKCSLTYGVLDRTVNGRRYLGAASNYLAELQPGDRMLVAVRKSHAAFHPPADIASTPSIMLCAGSGLAPFRGFVEERAAQRAAGRELAPALLFVGCRHPERDALYHEQFAQWARDGVVDVRYAFSRAADQSQDCKYVQDRLWKDREEARALWAKGAKMYVCGNSSVGEAVKRVFVDASLEAAKARGEEPARADVEAAFNKMRNERYAADVFA